MYGLTDEIQGLMSEKEELEAEIEALKASLLLKDQTIAGLLASNKELREFYEYKRSKGE